MGLRPETGRREPVSTHDVLTAWQAGRLSSRRALTLTNLDFVSELYAAALDSGVSIREDMLPAELRATERATAAIEAMISEGAEVRDGGR